MMLIRSIIRANTLPACVNGHLTKNLNTNADPKVQYSKPENVQDSGNHVESQHLKPSIESVSCWVGVRFIIILPHKIVYLNLCKNCQRTKTC